MTAIVYSLATQTCVNENGTLRCTGLGGLAAGFLAGIILFYVVIVAISIVAWVKILSKAGYSGWWVLIGFVPLVGVVFFLIFAFSDWPIFKQMRTAGPTSGYGSSGWAPPGAPQPGLVDIPPFSPTGPGAPAPWGQAAVKPWPMVAAAAPPEETEVSTAVPGWYPVEGQGERYWDGTAWTDSIR
jgi:hypothetical protein